MVTSAWWVSLSSRVAVEVALGKTVFQSGQVESFL